jgi:hypothetical protein
MINEVSVLTHLRQFSYPTAPGPSGGVKPNGVRLRTSTDSCRVEDLLSARVTVHRTRCVCTTWRRAAALVAARNASNPACRALDRRNNRYKIRQSVIDMALT